MKSVIGVCLGASTVTFVDARAGEGDEIKIEKTFRIPHGGNPKEVFVEELKKFNSDNRPVVATGRKFKNLVNLTTISEPEATEVAYRQVNKSGKNFSAIAGLGGETFILYTLDDEGGISNVITKNQCASGTGEFFLQQIKRMDLGLDEVLEISAGAEPFKVSGRCSVFCKSDCTHALNKGVPKSEVSAGLSLMMAEKVEELLKKSRDGSLMVVGGVTQNNVVMNFLREKVDTVDIPEEATYFEALGAAVYGIKNFDDIIQDLDYDKIFIDKGSSFTFHEPLEKFVDKVKFETLEKDEARPGDRCVLGLDVGSTTTKAVVIRESDDKILGSVYLYTHGNPIAAAKKCYAELLRQIPVDIELIGVGTTGSGRHIAGLHALTEGVINEIVAHATAATYFDPEVDTIFEIGGQDAKYTYIVNKVPADYAMNEACSAGTGSFIEEAAYESLGVKVTDIEPIAMNAQKPPNFSDQCAAFISSDIKTALHENISKPDILAGLVYSICLNYVNRVKASRPVGKKIFMQGGVCYNKAVPIAMAALAGTNIVVPPEPGLMGAFGVALEVKEKIRLGLLDEKRFSLKDLSERDAEYGKPFICKGGREKCDLRCSINMIKIEGKKYPFGGACNRYYNALSKSVINSEEYDYVRKRQKLMFEKYAPVEDLPENAPTVGINASFHTQSIYPLYHNFFTKLGFRVIVSDVVEERGLDREATSFCFPAQLTLGLFQNLVDRNPDYYFVPNLLEMHVNEEEHYRIDYNATCVFVITEPYYIKQAFKDVDFGDRLLAPTLNFAPGFGAEEKKFIDIAKKIGVDDPEKARKAYRFAVKMQDDFQTELFETGERFLKELESDPDKFAIVLVGRPYNSFTEHANKGIPQKFASRGVYVLPYDMFDYREETVDDNMYWEGGKKILKSAKIIKRHPQLFATYVSNFSCGPDSFIISTFRNIMGTKPSLTLELDSHSADAGINTRIDAALDIIKNYRKIEKNVKDPDYSDFRPAQIEYGEEMSYYISSDGERIPLNSDKIKILIPSMGDLSAAMFAAALRAIGFNAWPLPESNNDILKYGRRHTTGKECLPAIICAGALVDHVENRRKGEEHVVYFNVDSSGSCRIGQYPVLFKDLIRKKRWKNVGVMLLTTDDGYAGLGPSFSRRGMQGLLTADVMDDIRSAIMAHAVDPESGVQIFDAEFAKVVDAFAADPDKLYDALKVFATNIKNKVPWKIPISEAKYIALTGEIYVRRDHFSHRYLNKRFAEKGFVLKDAYITEWIIYIDYLVRKKLIEPDKSFKNKMERWIRDVYIRYAETRIKSILAKTGYYEFSRTKVEPLLKASEHILPLDIKGESGLTIGAALHETFEHYAGVINLGPFGCMPTRVSEAIAEPNMNVQSKIEAEKKGNKRDWKPGEIFNGKMNIPFLTIETDGNVYPQVIEARIETFSLQAERAAKLMKIAKNGKNGKAK